MKEILEWHIQTKYNRDRFVQETGICWQCNHEKATITGKCRKCIAEGDAALKAITDDLRSKGVLI